ncbi:MAG: UDP-3-O-(3-hydroxymyristoyl)glucosamine N-acyltransferase [Pseudomonadota bacterium]
MPHKISELAVRFGCDVVGDPDSVVDHVATLRGAGAGALSFLANPSYRKYLEGSDATAIVVAEADVESVKGAALVAQDPYLTYARIARVLHPRPVPAPGVHRSAVLGNDTEIGEGASIAAGVVIDANSRVGAHTAVGAGTYVGPDVQIGSECWIGPNVTIMGDTVLGDRCVVHPGAVIGSDGFGIARGPDGWEHVPQVGGVRIGDDVDVGACTSIDRGAIEPTRIGNGVKLDNQIQIGHNCVIGEHTVMAGMVGIAGSTTIGKNCAFGGNSGTVGHVDITDGVVITARCTVTSNIDTPGTYGGVFPHDEIRNHQRSVARFRQLDTLARQLKRLQRALKSREE